MDEEVLQTGGENISEETITGSDGVTRNLVTKKTLYRDPSGDGFVVAIGWDVTDQKQAEQELLEKEAMFRQSQKMEAIGRLAGGVAHDFNNLLTAIIGYAEMLKLNTTLDSTVRHGVEEIRKSADRAAVLTQQLLAFGRKQMMQPKVMDVNSLISETRAMLNRLIGEHITLETKLNAQHH